MTQRAAPGRDRRRDEGRAGRDDAGPAGDRRGLCRRHEALPAAAGSLCGAAHDFNRPPDRQSGAARSRRRRRLRAAGLESLVATVRRRLDRGARGAGRRVCRLQGGRLRVALAGRGRSRAVSRRPRLHRDQHRGAAAARRASDAHPRGADRSPRDVPRIARRSTTARRCTHSSTMRSERRAVSARLARRRPRSTPGARHGTCDAADARRWAYALIGQVATDAVLLAATPSRLTVHVARAEQRFEPRSRRRARAPSRTSASAAAICRHGPATSPSIGDIEQSLAGEDHDLDGLLRRGVPRRRRRQRLRLLRWNDPRTLAVAEPVQAAHREEVAAPGRTSP